MSNGFRYFIVTVDLTSMASLAALIAISNDRNYRDFSKARQVVDNIGRTHSKHSYWQQPHFQDAVHHRCRNERSYLRQCSLTVSGSRVALKFVFLVSTQTLSADLREKTIANQ